MVVPVFNELAGVGDVLEGDGLPNNVSSLALEAAHVVKSGPGALFGFTVLNTKNAAQYIQLHDSLGGVPADGAVPVWCIVIAGAADREFQWVTPRYFGQGIVLCNSSTAATKTVGAADCFFDVQYI